MIRHRSPPPPVVHRIAITKEFVPSYYELGWRFVGFGFQIYFFEWSGKSEPRYPAEEMRRAA